MASTRNDVGPGLRGTIRLALAAPALRRYQIGGAAWRVADLALLVAVSVHLFERSGAGAVAAFGVGRSIAPAIGVPVLTALASRRRAGAVLAGAALLGAGASALAAMLIVVDGPVVLIVVVNAAACIGLYSFRPILTGLLPCLVRTPQELVAVNATAGVVDGISTLAGPLAAGAGVAVSGAAPVAAACAVLLVGAAAVLRPLARTTIEADGDAGERGAGRWYDGFTSLAASSFVAAVVTLSVGQTLVRGALNVLVVVLAVDGLDLGDGGPGLLLGAIGIGAMAGFPLAIRVTRPGQLGRSLALAVVLWGTPIAVSAFAGSAVVVVALFAVIGFANDIVDIAVFSLLQRLVPERRLTRALGAFETVVYVGTAAGSYLGARLFDAAGLGPALVATGAVLPILAAAAFAVLVSLDRTLRQRDDAVALLQLQALFSPLTMSIVDRLASRVQEVVAAEGEVLMRKGEAGDRYLLIEEGTVSIVDDGRIISQIGAGDGLGEVALVRGVPRTATAIAASPVRARSLAAADFLHGIKDDEARAAAERLIDERLAELKQHRAAAAVTSARTRSG